VSLISKKNAFQGKNHSVKFGTWYNKLFRRKPTAPDNPVEELKTQETAPPPSVQAPAEKPAEMNFEDILSTIQQIEEIVGSGGDVGEETVQLDAIQMPFADMVNLAPDAFNVSRDEVEGKTFEVLVQDLYGQLAKGKVETSLHHFLAGVPPRYLATSKTGIEDRMLTLPLPLVVRLMDPEQLKAKAAPRKMAPSVEDLPDLFSAGQKAAPEAAAPVAPEKVEAPLRPSIMLPLGVMAGILPDSFRLPAGLTAYPAIKIKVEIDDLFSKLTAGKVEVRRLDFLINVPSQFLAPPTGGFNDDMLTLPLQAVVGAIPPEEWQKRAGPSQAAADLGHLPDLFAYQAPPPPPPPVEEKAPEAEAPTAVEEEAPMVSADAPVEEAERPAEEPVAEPVAEPEPAPVEEPVISPPAPVEKIKEEPAAVAASERIPAAAREESVVEPKPEAMPEPAPVEKKPVWDEDLLLKKVLGDEETRQADFSEVAARFKDVGGFEGCAIIHREGDLLATSWTHKATDMLEVISPQIWKRVSGYVEHLGEGEMKSVTVSVAQHLLTFVQEGDLCFVAVHQPDQFDLARLSWVQRVAAELGRRFGAKASSKK
jgi:predicted regulator of Ras-like GTPase activity (Roadblock/LC7/MglB family)